MMNQDEDWNATREFEEMEQMDALDSSKKQKPKKKRSGVSVLLILSSVVAVVAVVLIGFMVADNLGIGNEASAVSEQELSEAKTVDAETEEMTVIDINDTLVVTNGGANTETSETEEQTKDSTGTTADTSGDYIFADSNSRYLTDSDLAGMSKEMLRLARNEIYARHGYIFNDSELRDYFNSKSWYHPTTSSDSFNENVLNAYEKANVTKIKSFE